MKHFIPCLVFALAAGAAQAKIYVVAPMVCTGQWNQNPGGWQPENEHVKLVAVSANSVRAKDCSLAPTGTTETGILHEDGTSDVSETIEAKTWAGSPLRVQGQTVTAPFDYRASPFTLQIVGSETKNGQRIDHLKGRGYLNKQKTIWYDYDCSANVVDKPWVIINSTKSCPTPAN